MYQLAISAESVHKASLIKNYREKQNVGRKFSKFKNG